MLVIIATTALLYSSILGLQRAYADSVIENIHIDETLNRVAFDSDNGYTYVTKTESNAVCVIDGLSNTEINTISVGK